MKPRIGKTAGKMYRENYQKDVGSRFCLLFPKKESHTTPAGRLQPGPSRISWELPGAQRWCLHRPLVLSAGRRASDSLPVPALEMANIILKCKTGVYA